MQARPWRRIADNPLLTPDQADAREFEKATLYKSSVIWDKSASLGYPFVMFYNAKQQGPWIERIGMAVSDDMLHWRRYGTDPVIDNGRGISGDPQIVRMGDCGRCSTSAPVGSQARSTRLPARTIW